MWFCYFPVLYLGNVDLMSTIVPKETRSPLKWPGGKKRVLKYLRDFIPADNCQRLVEPFVGGGSVFLNLEFDEYLLCDVNKDLISFFRIVQTSASQFIRDARKLFTQEHNCPEKYYFHREQFNTSDDEYHKALLFLYLNRHGYNGLCRYNAKGAYNVPFGRYSNPYFPEAELKLLAEKASRATFILGDFELAFSQLRSGDVVYCDPPYSPINRTANFTAYSGNNFGDEDQQRLVDKALSVSQLGVSTVISNHYVEFTKALYEDADELSVFSVQRSISQIGHNRKKVDEVLALYRAQ